MADPRQLVDEFALRFEAGEEPDPSVWLAKAEGAERQELARLIDRYLMTTPRRAWDPAAYESSTAKEAVDRVYESLAGVSGTWPELLPRLRDAARVKRSDLVRRLAESLGFGERAQVEKVGTYYHRMEHGLLPAEGVSERVIEALAGIVGASAETIRRAGGGGSGEAGGPAAPAFARKVLADATAAPAAYEAADLDRAAGERDEIDRLFTAAE